MAWPRVDDLALAISVNCAQNLGVPEGRRPVSKKPLWPIRTDGYAFLLQTSTRSYVLCCTTQQR